MRTKQASIIAQIYVLCVRILASVAEQILQKLLALPTYPVQYSSSSTSVGTMQTTYSLQDLEGPADPFSQAHQSALHVLSVGSRQLGEMEDLLGVPSQQWSGVPRAGSKQPSSVSDGRCQLPLSLSARLIVSIWDDELSTTGKLPLMYMRRCRAAIVAFGSDCL